MAIEPIIRLTSPDVLKMLSETKQKVVNTLISDKFRPTDSNKVGLYPHPISHLSWTKYDDDSSDDNDSVLEEDGAKPQLLNKELGFLFTAPRTMQEAGEW